MVDWCGLRKSSEDKEEEKKKIIKKRHKEWQKNANPRP